MQKEHNYPARLWYISFADDAEYIIPMPSSDIRAAIGYNDFQELGNTIQDYITNIIRLERARTSAKPRNEP